MRKGMFVRSILGLALVSLVSSLQASTITIGGTPLAGTGNCDPFGCPQFFGLGTYQQVYSSSAFSGQSTIEGITFYDDQVENGAIPAGGTFTLSFSYTSNSPNALDLASPSANIDSASQTFYGGVLPSLSGNMLTFSGNPFVYNPALGNLLLTVSVINPVDRPTVLYLDQSSSTAQTTSAYFGNFNGKSVTGGNMTGGLVTGFNVFINNTATPEPGTVLLMLGGFGLIAYKRWGQKRA